MESNTTKWAKFTCLVAGGAVVGAVSAVLLSRALAPSPVAERRDVPQRPASNALPAQVARLEARLRELERTEKLAAPAPSAPAAGEDDPMETERPPPEVVKARFWQKVRQSEADHAAEPLDPTWSKKATSLLSSDLARVAEKAHFRVDAVDCRTTTCAVRVAWPTRSQAQTEFSQLMHYPYKANCERSVVVDEASEQDGTTRALMMLDCETWRADGEIEFDAFKEPGKT